MKPLHALPIAAAISLSLLAACSKPADPATTAVNPPADATASASGAGGAVSPPAANGAVNTDANKTSGDLASASNSFTEGQAKGHIKNAGYSDVTNLTKTPDGLWTASAKKDGKPVNVAVDFKGAVTTN